MTTSNTLDRQLALIDRLLAEGNSPDGKLVQCKGQIGGCLYRGSDGTRCFVGKFIPDEVYRQRKIEGLSAGELMEIGVLDDCPDLAGLDERFLNDFQDVHDGFDPTATSFNDSLEAELRKFRDEVEDGQYL